MELVVASLAVVTVVEMAAGALAAAAMAGALVVAAKVEVMVKGAAGREVAV